MLSKRQAIKILAGVLVLWLLINMVLFAVGKISVWVFWIILLVFGIIAYKGVPWLRKSF